MYSVDEIKKLIEEHSPEIAEMQSKSKEYSRHFSGTGTDDFLKQINNYENSGQHELRKNFAISNKWLTDELLRPIDNIWSAKGGELKVVGSNDAEKRVKSKVDNIKKGYSLRNYMKEIWLQRFIIDPNGVQFIEVSEDGKQVYPTYKSIFNIQAYKRIGIWFEWIAFEPHLRIKGDEEVKEKEQPDVEYFWFVDEEYYYLIKRKDDKYEQANRIDNSFGEVPAITNSTIYDTEMNMMVSPIDKQVGLLDSYLIKNSVKEIYQYLHNYPIFWQYQTLCPMCQGKKKLPDGNVCELCNGTGLVSKKDVSDVFLLKKNKEDEQPDPNPPAGYVQSEIGTMSENRNELDWMFDKLFHSMWGTTTEKVGNETATGRFIDIMPVNNKLNLLADIAQTIETEILRLSCSEYQSVQEVSVVYGRRYMIESADEIWKRYINARKEKASVTVLDYFIEQFYMTEFANNGKQAEYYFKLLRVEPYVHNSIEEVMALSVSGDIKLRKLYFPEWSKTVPVTLVIEKKPDALIDMLDKYIEDKQLKQQENERQTEAGEGGEGGEGE